MRSRWVEVVAPLGRQCLTPTLAFRVGFAHAAKFDLHSEPPQEEKERIERAKAARAKAEAEVQEARSSKVMPQLEALEVQWSRLHAITGAEAPEEVISHWTGGPCRVGL